MSPLRYPGGKSWLVPVVRTWLKLNPRHTLIEPFAGGASISLAAVSEGLATGAVLCDLDEDIARFWHVVLSPDAHRLIKKVFELPVTEEAARAVLDADPASQVDAAFQTLLRNRLARGGMLAPQAGLLRRGGHDKGLLSRWYPETLARRIRAINAMRDRLHFRHGDGLAVLEDAAARPDVTAFIDPPYTSYEARRPGTRLYRHHSLDHGVLFATAAEMSGDVLMTYDDATTVRTLALAHDFDTRRLTMLTAHHRRANELLVGRDLRWLPLATSGTRPPRHHASSKRRDVASVPSVQPGKIANLMNPVSTEEQLLPASEAAALLGVSRRTLDRLMARGEVERVAGTDGRTYVTRRSAEALQRARQRATRRRLRAPDAATLLDAVERLLEALREERAATLAALADREAARVELATAQAELLLLRRLPPDPASAAGLGALGIQRTAGERSVA